MSNPFRSLKYLPWRILLQSAAVTIAIATILDYLILQSVILIAANSTISFPRSLLVYLQFLAPFAASYGIGALGLFITARFFREVLLSANTIWALIGCLILMYWISTLLPVPHLLMFAETFNIVMIALGAFFSGKRYWRY